MTQFLIWKGGIFAWFLVRINNRYRVPTDVIRFTLTYIPPNLNDLLWLLQVFTVVMFCTRCSCWAETGTVVILLGCSLLMTLKYAVFAKESYFLPPVPNSWDCTALFVACGGTVILVTKFAAHNLGADLQVLICWPVFLEEFQALISLIYFFGYLLMCCSTTGKPTRSFATEHVSLHSV